VIKDSGIVSGLSWVADILGFSVTNRKKVRRLVLEGILNFKRGKPSKEATDFVNYLKQEGQFVGFATNMTYVMENSKYADELESIWIHPLSEPSLLYKIKDMPILIVTNPNIEYNDSVLNKIEENKYNKILQKVIKNSRGLNG
jgi:predicted secreted acid phosphatase